MMDLQRDIWEGWTPLNFIEELEPLVDMVMYGESFIEPFRTKKELVKFVKENQPYYKKSIPEVNAYFAKKYGLQ